MNAKEYISHLDLTQHPEGGYFRQTYSSSELVSLNALPKRFSGDRPFSTAIFYLLEQGDFSNFHRIQSDECWHFYAGDSLYIHVIHDDGMYRQVKLGNQPKKGDVFQFVVPAGAWFAAEPAPGTNFALTGCTVAPGFDFSDFEMGNKGILISRFPQHEALLDRLCR